MSLAILLVRRIKNNPLWVYLYFTLATLTLLSLSRIFLAIWQSERINLVDGWSAVILQGMRIDLATLAIFLVVPSLISTLFFHDDKVSVYWRKIQQIWFTILVYVLVFMELSTPSFIMEYNIRPNRLFVEYLIYPKEVFSMLIKSHLIELIFTLVISMAIAYFTWKKSAELLSKVKSGPLMWRPLSFICCFFILAMAGRSTLGHRPINPAMVYFSSDPLVNSLILNSTYSVGFSIKQLLAEESSNNAYGQQSEQQIMENMRALKGLNNDLSFDKNIPTLASQIPSYQGKPKNLVIILQESLGARFVGALGGLPLTPNIDKLSHQGWFFRKMFATGTRSVRGIEAVITGFTPTPDRAVVKLDKSQKDFFTLASLLKSKGYHTEFIYGGEAHFDNMKSFFLGNGFDHITEEKDYEGPHFAGSWGVSDEDLFNKSHQKFEQFSQSSQPFFSLVFTSSNHTPFEYPSGRIQAYDEVPNTRNNAIQYADWALGDFFEKAKKSNYWKDTLFLVIADHDANAHGNGLVPPKSFHIPALILGEGIEPIQDERVVSQLDMPVTMLSLMGIQNQNPMLGQDLSFQQADFTERLYLQYGENFAMLNGDKMTILQPEKPPTEYLFNSDDFSLTKIAEVTDDEAKIAISALLWGKLAYQKQLYRLSRSKSKTSPITIVSNK